MQKIKLIVLNSYEIENRDLYLIKAFLKISACQDSDAKKCLESSSEKFSLGEKCSIGTLNELNRVFLEKS